MKNQYDQNTKNVFLKNRKLGEWEAYMIGTNELKQAGLKVPSFATVKEWFHKADMNDHVELLENLKKKQLAGQCCKKCKHFHIFHAGGCCRRYAPGCSSGMLDDCKIIGWPIVNEWDVCGEYEQDNFEERF